MARNAFQKAFTGYNRKSSIPGVSGRKMPGSPSAPRKVGGFLTGVPRIEGDSAKFREYHRQQIRDVSGRFQGGWGFAWVGLAALDDALYRWADQKEANIRTAVENLAEEMRAYMQAHAPWTDRTSEEREADGDPGSQSARRELQAVVVWDDEHNFRILLGHGKNIYYGIWLEVRWGGKYAILVPTAEHFAPRIAGKIKAVT